MSLERTVVKIVLCFSLAGCHAVTGEAVRRPTPRPESTPDANRKGDSVAGVTLARAQSPEIRPVDAEGGVVHLRLSEGGLREWAGDAPLPLPKPVIDLPPPDANRIPALQRELARQLALKVDDLRAKLQVLNAQVMSRSTPPEIPSTGSVKTTVAEPKRVVARIAEPLPAPAPILAETPMVRPVAHTEPTVPGDAPAASQREINRLITQCLSDLEKEVRELDARVRAIAPPGK